MKTLTALSLATALSATALIYGIATTHSSDTVIAATEHAADTPFTGCIDHTAATNALQYAGYDIVDMDTDALTTKWATSDKTLPRWVLVKYTDDNMVCLADYDRRH